MFFVTGIIITYCKSTKIEMTVVASFRLCNVIAYIMCGWYYIFTSLYWIKFALIDSHTWHESFWIIVRIIMLPWKEDVSLSTNLVSQNSGECLLLVTNTSGITFLPEADVIHSLEVNQNPFCLVSQRLHKLAFRWHLHRQSDGGPLQAIDERNAYK